MYSKESFLGSLREVDRDALLEAGTTRHWQQGELVVRAGDRADFAIVLLGGLVKVHTGRGGGAEVLLALRGPGDLLGEISAVHKATRMVSATALKPVQGIVIGASNLRTFLAGHPRAALPLLDLALARLQAGDARLLEFASSESLPRVASRLIELTDRFGIRRDGGELEVELPITQEELAQWSASSTESTARALRTLRGLGLIETHRGRLVVLDLDGLRAHAARL